MVYLPVDLAGAGTKLEVEVLGDRISAQVVETPLIDPKGEKLRT
jgi:glycine cleavage system aminomethyltransferase T